MTHLHAYGVNECSPQEHCCDTWRQPASVSGREDPAAPAPATPDNTVISGSRTMLCDIWSGYTHIRRSPARVPIKRDFDRKANLKRVGVRHRFLAMLALTRRLTLQPVLYSSGTGTKEAVGWQSDLRHPVRDLYCQSEASLRPQNFIKPKTTYQEPEAQPSAHG